MASYNVENANQNYFGDLIFWLSAWKFGENEVNPFIFLLIISENFVIENHVFPPKRCITKISLFKYMENLTSKKTENFQIKKTLIFFIFLLKT